MVNTPLLKPGYLGCVWGGMWHWGRVGPLNFIFDVKVDLKKSESHVFCLKIR